MLEELFCQYIMLNFLLAFGYLCSSFLIRISLNKIISFKQKLKINRFLLLYIPCIYLLVFFIKLYYYPDPTFVLQLPNIDALVAHHIAAHSPQISSTNELNLSDYFYISLLIIIAISAFLRIINFILQLIKLNRMVLNSIGVRRCGNLSIVVSDQINIPFCFSFMGSSYVVITNDLLENHLNYKLAIKHELQHIRQKDTRWVYLFELFKIIFYLNPFIHHWLKSNSELQELACDEALINERLVCVEDYAYCLLTTAEQIFSRKSLAKEAYSAAVGLFHSKKSLTSRRIMMLFKHKRTLNKRGLVFFISAFILSVIVTTSYAVGVTAYHPKKSLDQPLVTSDYIKTWSSEAVLKTFNYDYTNYKKNLESASHYFIPEGWKDFMTALKTSGNIDAVVTKKLTLSASFNNEPTIIKQGVENGRYTWHIKIPTTITYSGKTISNKQSSIVNLLIIRTNETSSGIGISEYWILPESDK